jgi:hypothetical protein
VATTAHAGLVARLEHALEDGGAGGQQGLAVDLMWDGLGRVLHGEGQNAGRVRELRRGINVDQGVGARIGEGEQWETKVTHGGMRRQVRLAAVDDISPSGLTFSS